MSQCEAGLTVQQRKQHLWGQCCSGGPVQMCRTRHPGQLRQSGRREVTWSEGQRDRRITGCRCLVRRYCIGSNLQHNRTFMQEVARGLPSHIQRWHALCALCTGGTRGSKAENMVEVFILFMDKAGRMHHRKEVGKTAVITRHVRNEQEVSDHDLNQYQPGSPLLGRTSEDQNKAMFSDTHG